jgi:hypothetical protein
MAPLLAGVLPGCKEKSPTTVGSDKLVFLPGDSGLSRASAMAWGSFLVYEASPTHLSFAFDTADCGVFLAWKGPALLLKGSYDSVLYFGQEPRRFWRVVRGADTLEPKVRFRGVTGLNGALALRFHLVLPDGDSVVVQSYMNHDDHYGDHALETEFHFTGLDSGMAAILELGAGKRIGRWPLKWSGSVGRLEDAPGAERYVQEFDGVGQVKLTFEGSADL